MPRTNIPIQEIGYQNDIDELTFTAADATNDHSFVNTGRELLIIKNDDASAKVTTILSVADKHGRTGDLAPSTDATSVGIAGPFLPGIWNQSGGVVNVDLTADTSLFYAVVRFRL